MASGVGGHSTGTMIVGNVIGLDRSQHQKVGNRGDGIDVTDAASKTTIGGTTAYPDIQNVQNVISDNAGDGVNIGAGTISTTLNMNDIGLSGDSLSGLGFGNGGDGVHILGRDVRLAGNLLSPHYAIAGNQGHGISVSGSNAQGTVIQGYRIGTNDAGTARVPNSVGGILVTDAANVLIGSSQASASYKSGHLILGNTSASDKSGNLISGNSGAGIAVTDSAGTMIQGNLVGTDLSGSSGIGNTQKGIVLENADQATIGGNTVSSNGQVGIMVGESRSGSSSGTTITRNKIGTSVDGNKALGNDGNGVLVTDHSDSTTISGNLIAANTDTGVVFDVDATHLALTANVIGRPLVDAKGNNRGVYLEGQSASLRLNTVSANTATGISLSSTARDIIIQRNFIGTSTRNAPNVGNGGDGIVVHDLATALIGGPTATDGNVISGNKGSGIKLINSRAGTDQVMIEGNSIGVDDFGTRGHPERSGRHPARREQRGEDPDQPDFRQRPERHRPAQWLEQQPPVPQQDRRGSQRDLLGPQWELRCLGSQGRRRRFRPEHRQWEHHRL